MIKRKKINTHASRLYGPNSYVISQLSKDPQTIVLYGRSLGSGPTCYLAERLSTKGCVPAGVILQVRELENLSLKMYSYMPGFRP